MKIYISADIEGVAGSVCWNDCSKKEAEYQLFAKQMTDEVVSACNAAFESGAEEIYINDAHATGRNIDFTKLPDKTTLIRGWSEHPFAMMQELDDTFDAVLFIGYHDTAIGDENPLAHTINGGKVREIRLNGEVASEFLINTYTAGYCDVPVVFLSGDTGIVARAKDFIPNIKVAPVKSGIGGSVLTVNSKTALSHIEDEVKTALTSSLNACKIDMPDEFEMTITFNKHMDTYRASFYPGAEKINSHTVAVKSTDYMDILTALSFLV